MKIQKLTLDSVALDALFRSIWLRHNFETFKKRLAVLEEKSAKEGVVDDVAGRPEEIVTSVKSSFVQGTSPNSEKNLTALPGFHIESAIQVICEKGILWKSGTDPPL